MKLQSIAGAGLFRRAAHRPQAATRPPITGRAAAEPHAAFRVQTFPHAEAIYSDALCLTGSREDAADLVVATYVRALLGYEQFQRGRVPAHLRGRRTLAWLFGHMHAAFCAGVLAHTDCSTAQKGERPC